MKRIDIKGGYSCNNNCRFCVLGDKRLKFKDRTTKEMLVEIKKAADRGFEKIVLTGGEITIRKDFFKLLKFAKKQGFKVIHVESNGKMFVYEDFVKKMVDNGANAFTISLHSASPEDYAYTTNSDQKSFDYLITGLKNLRRFTDKIGVNCTINKVNYKKLVDVVKLCQEIGIKSINFPFLNVCGNAAKNKEKMAVSYREASTYLRDALRYAKDNNISATTEMVPLCYLEGFEGSCVELYGKEMEVNALEYNEKDFMKSVKEGRIKSEVCSKCKYDKICYGILDDEQRDINLKELVSVLGEKVVSADSFLKKKDPPEDNLLLLNESCNINCIFCFNNKENPKNLGFEEAQQKIKDFSLVDKEKIIITGGEPLICPFLTKLIRECKKAGFGDILLQTNGVELDMEKLRDLKKAGLTSVLISIHSSDELTYNRITQSKGNFNRAIGALKNITKLGLLLNLSYVINEYNYLHIEEDLKYFADNFEGINMFEIGYAYKFNNNQKFNLVRLPKFEKQLHFALNYLKKSNRKFLIAYCGLPLCYLNGFEHYSSQVFNLLTKNQFSLKDVNNSIVKSEKCRLCSLTDFCYGFPKGYFKEFSDDAIPSNRKKEEIAENFKNLRPSI